MSSDEDGPEPVRVCAPAQDPEARRRLFPLTTVTTTRFQLAENPEQCHETNDSKEFNLVDFEREVVVLPKNDSLLWERRQRGFVVCTHAVGADQRETEYVPRYYDLSIPAVRKNEVFFWLDLYMDGSEYSTAHNSLTCGVRVANSHRWALHKDEAHHVFAVVAPDVDVQPILARLSLDLQVLARGHEVVCSSGTVTIFGGLGLVLADSVQRSSNLCHGGSASYFNCPHCRVTIHERLEWREEGEFDNTRSDSLNVSIVKAIEASGEPGTVKADCLRLMGICTTLGPGVCVGGW